MSLMRHSGTGTMTPQDGPSECQGDQGAGYVQFYYRTSAGCVWYYFIIIFKITNCAMGGGRKCCISLFFSHGEYRRLFYCFMQFHGPS